MYPCIRVLDRGPAHASKNGKVRRHRPRRDDATHSTPSGDTGEELFLTACDSRGVGGVGVLVDTSLSMNIDSFEQLTTRFGQEDVDQHRL
uniref:Uncharacterized protein n=1 Tax=Angiostrongylus cantonensis TaxID=6313 RepID=A0A0K0D7N7_ANGCA